MNSRSFVYSLLAASLLVALDAPWAWAHGSSTTSIHVGQNAGKLVVDNGVLFSGMQVFADNAEKFDSNGQTIVPGIGVDASLNSSVLRFRILDDLFYWTPANGLNAVTSNTLKINRTIFPAGQPDSALVGQAGISDALIHFWDAATVGESHHVLRYDVPLGAEAAAYGVLMQAEDVNSVLAPSDPFLLVLNNGLTNTPSSTAGQAFDGSQFGQALSAISVESVPEPSTWALMALGLAGCVLWRRRK